ncbi:hypothetical protein [Mycolicibacterium sp. HK-90]|uniref:hypothetical protein n=1 Tax=Mycolicibacterium sp. HK-90 TaxID=3056937 RepID=UPI002657B587|nr:hypothetical protein [Mycolicibacterium sp. HK-90]WKG02286.1 hypothetical protein QU592_24145 [Mycolicibacterium sp. HK-90]
MTTPIESSRRAIAHAVSGLRRREWRRSALTAGLVLAGAVVAILLSVATNGQWATAMASLAGFATAITVIAAAVISWEHIVVNARSHGLVETEVESR